MVAQLEECYARQTRRSAPTYRMNVVVNDNHDQNTISPPTEGLYVKRVSLSNIVQRFKSLTTHRYIEGVWQYGWSPFHKRLWQRNYYEHVIRDEADLETITDYILQNPQNWEKDEEYS